MPPLEKAGMAGRKLLAAIVPKMVANGHAAAADVSIKISELLHNYERLAYLCKL